MLMAGRRCAAGQGVPGESLDLLLNIAMNLELLLVFPGGSDGKESTCNAGDTGSIPGSGRSPGEVNGNPLLCSCLENSMDRRAWRVTAHGITKSRPRLSDFHFIEVKALKVC